MGNPNAGFVLHGRGVTPITVAATLTLPDETVGPFELSGTATITSISLPGDVQPGRCLIFYGAASVAATFTNTNDTTTAGQMDLGGANIVLNQQDVLVLMQKSNGTFIRVFSTDN